MQRILLAFAILTIGHDAGAVGVIPDLIWAHTPYVGASCQATLDVAVDGAGNSFLTGHFAGTTDFGGASLTASGYSDIFLLKYNASGNLVWVRQDGGVGTSSTTCDEGEGVAVDASGNLFVTGTFLDTAYFGEDSLVSAGHSDMFLAKYDALGNVLWVTKAGGAEADFGRDIAIDTSGDVFVVGEFRLTAGIGDTSFTSPGVNSPDIYVAKFANDGTFQWARQGTSAQQVVDPVVATDGNGNAIVTGSYKFAIDFDGNVLTGTGVNVFFAKYDGSGNILWVRSSDGADGETARDIATDSAGNIYATGEYSTTATFGDTTLTSVNTSYPEAFVVKYAGSGDALWARAIAGVIAGFDQIEGQGISVDGEDACLVTGFYVGSAVFGDTTLSNYSPLSSRGFAARYESSGDLSWAHDVGVTAPGLVTASDQNNNLFVGGNFVTSLMLGDTLILAPGFSMYYAKYGNSVVTAAPRTNVRDVIVELSQNAPNPFNPATRISFTLSERQHVRLSVFNVRGERVATVLDETRSAGRHTVRWNAQDMPSGIYFYRIRAGASVKTRKMVLLK